MPNILAYAAILGWPIVVGLLFARLPLRPALIWSILGGLLLLPSAFEIDLPMIPGFDRNLIPSLAALAMCLAVNRGPRAVAPEGRWLPRGALGKTLVLACLFEPFLTVAVNPDPIFYPGTVLPGLRPYDGFAFFYSRMELILPLLLAHRFLTDDASHALLLRAIVAAALVYTLPILVELRMSPQIHTWVYGYYPHSFGQTVRGWGWRPSVFMPHGLWLATFMLMATLAAAALWRGWSGAAGARWMLATGWLGLVLAAMNSLGALLLAVVFVPVARFFGTRLQMILAAGVGALMLLYPMLRSADWVPTDAIVSAMSSISEARADSLAFRFDNEDVLLERANERFLFGWGGYNRNRVFDPETGKDLTITDSRWIIVFGVYGWTGFIVEFGLLSLPLLLAARRRSRLRLPPQTAGLCLILAVNLVDLMINSASSSLTWLIAGAVLARAGRREAETPREEPVPSPTPRARRRAAIGSLEPAG